MIVAHRRIAYVTRSVPMQAIPSLLLHPVVIAPSAVMANVLPQHVQTQRVANICLV
jgi:hypothetical protein